MRGRFLVKLCLVAIVNCPVILGCFYHIDYISYSVIFLTTISYYKNILTYVILFKFYV